jgi:hypothetical protein
MPRPEPPDIEPDIVLHRIASDNHLSQSPLKRENPKLRSKETEPGYKYRKDSSKGMTVKCPSLQSRTACVVKYDTIQKVYEKERFIQ